VGFPENQRLLELVWDPGDQVMGSIYLKIGEKAVISKKRVACSRHYYAFYSCLVDFSKNQRHLQLVWDPGDRVMSSLYLKMGEKKVISEEH